MKQQQTLLFVTDSNLPFRIVWVAMLITNRIVSTSSSIFRWHIKVVHRVITAMLLRATMTR
jgi:hypothetical protein